MITIDCLELYEGTKVTQTNEATPINNLNVRRRIYTNEIKIPNTPKNRKKFDDGKWMFTTNVYTDGNPLMMGVNAIIKDETAEDITIELRVPDYDIFDKLGDMTLGELFSDCDHNITPSIVAHDPDLDCEPDINTCIVEHYSDSIDYKYYLMDYGRGITKLSGIIIADINTLYPTISLDRVFKRIARNLEIDVRLDAINYYTHGAESRGSGDNLFSDCQKIEESTKIIYLAGKMSDNANEATSYQCNDNIISANLKHGGSAENPEYWSYQDIEHYLIDIPKSGKYNLDFSEIRYKSNEKPTVDYTPTITLYVNDREYNIDNRIVLNLRGGDTLTYTTSVVGSVYPFRLPPNNYVAIYTDGSVKISSLEPDRFFKKMFDIKLSTIIKDLLQRYNAVLFYNRVYKYYTIKAVDLSLDTSHDWSSKYIGNYSCNYKISGWVKTNWFKDKNGGYAGRIDLVNSNIKDSENPHYTDEKPMITSELNGVTRSRYNYMYIPGEDSVIPSQTYHVPRFPIIINDNYGVGIARKLDGPVSYRLKDGDETTIIRQEGAIANYNEEGSYHWMVQKYYASLIRALRPLKYGESETVNLQVPAYYTFTAWLSPDDISGLLPRKIWIEQLNSYFIVFAINQYEPGKPTKIEALKTLY